MNQSIIDRTNKKLQENQKAEDHFWQYNAQGIIRKYHIFKNVFSPAIFMGSQWLTQKLVQLCTSQDKILQIGCGCGVTSIQIALTHKSNKIMACDINKDSVLNTKSNMKTYGIQIQVVHSDMFENIPQQKFDIIYWNFPFHPSQTKQHMTMLERAIRDPGYKILSLFLSKARQFLSNNGKILLGFHLLMGDIQRLEHLAIQFKWLLKVKYTIQTGMCLIQLR